MTSRITGSEVGTRPAAGQEPAPANSLRALALILLSAGLAAILAGAAYHFLTPRLYRAKADVVIQFRQAIRQRGPEADSQASTENGLMLSECQVVLSDDLLQEAIAQLELVKTWSQGRAASSPLKPGDALELLRSRLQVKPLRGANVLRVEAISPTPEEAAAIANKLAQLYYDYRVSRPRNLNVERIEALEKEWSEQSKKVAAAQENLAEAAAAIQQARATNSNRVYDAASLEELRSKRMELEARYVSERSLMAGLKSYDARKLRLVLPTIGTNATFDAAVEKLDAAELALAAASASATNATEVTHATIAVNQLSNQLSQVMAGVLLVREAGVDSLKSLLDNLDDELRHATTNIDLFSTNTPAYQNALADLRYAEEQSLSLRERLDGERKDAPVPLALTAEIVSRAEPPRRPASPNRILTAGLLSGGTLAGILGVLLLCIPDRRPPKQAGPIQLSPGRRLS